MRQNYTTQARNAIKLAEQTAMEAQHTYIGSEHLLLGLIREGKGTAAAVLSEFGIDTARVQALIDKLITPESAGDVLVYPKYSPAAEQILQRAADNAAADAAGFHTAERDDPTGVAGGQAGVVRIGTEHILTAILQTPDCIATRLLFTMDISVQKVFAALQRALDLPEDRQKERTEQFVDALNHGDTEGSATPFLDRFSRDLTALAKARKLDPVVGRDKELERMLQILCRRSKNNPCLIGDPGVGKTAVTEGLAQMIATGNVPTQLADKRVVMLDLSAMIAGTKYRGEFEERIKHALEEVAYAGNILLFVDELHTLIGAGGAEGAMDASNILKPALARGELQMIGATTTDEYRKRIEKDAALERRFQSVMIEEPTEAVTLHILGELRPYYENHHEVTISDEALDAAVQLSVRYINDRFLPDKAIDLMDEAASRVQLKRNVRRGDEELLVEQLSQWQEKKEIAIESGDFDLARDIQQQQDELREDLEKIRKRKSRSKRASSAVVTAEHVAETVASWTGIPVSKITEQESTKLTRMEKLLHARVIGQDEAVSVVAKAVRRGRVGLKDPTRPIGSFLFLGPTGVGKTELSKALAESVFGSESALIRVDMSEYMEKHSVSKMIGSPPGYVGYEEGGQLAEKVRRNPYSVILFDEIEKAHPDVFNVLLQVLDDGHITDAQGRKVSFKETIIIMTSNAGASAIVQPKKLGFLSTEDEEQDYKRMKQGVMDEVNRIFRPEFLNRIDDTIVFHSLTKNNMKEIARIQIKDLQKRSRENLSIELKVTATAVDHLISDSFDSKFGARPLRRAVQSKIENPLAEKILNGEIHAGKTARVSWKSGDFVFEEIGNKL